MVDLRACMNVMLFKGFFLFWGKSECLYLCDMIIISHFFDRNKRISYIYTYAHANELLNTVMSTTLIVALPPNLRFTCTDGAVSNWPSG